MLASHSPAPRRHRVSNIESIRLQQMLLMLSPSVLALHSCLSLLFLKKSSVATGIGEVEKYSDLNSNAVMLMSAGYISQKKKKKNTTSFTGVLACNTVQAQTLLTQLVILCKWICGC